MNISYDFLHTSGLTLEEIFVLVEPYKEEILILHDKITNNDFSDEVKNRLKSIVKEMNNNWILKMNDLTHPLIPTIESLQMLIRTKEILSNS